MIVGVMLGVRLLVVLLLVVLQVKIVAVEAFFATVGTDGGLEVTLRQRAPPARARD